MSGPTGRPTRRSVLAALQDALAAEQRAAFGYAVLGPRLRGAEQAYAVTCSDAHETLRDATAQQLAAAGQTPQPPAADYPQLYPAGGVGAVLAGAVALEESCAAAWRYVFAVVASAAAPGRSAGPANRAAAQSALTASAVRAATWRTFAGTTPSTVPFPGA